MLTTPPPHCQPSSLSGALHAARAAHRPLSGRRRDHRERLRLTPPAPQAADEERASPHRLGPFSDPSRTLLGPFSEASCRIDLVRGATAKALRAARDRPEIARDSPEVDSRSSERSPEIARDRPEVVPRSPETHPRVTRPPLGGRRLPLRQPKGLRRRAAVLRRLRDGVGERRVRRAGLPVRGGAVPYRPGTQTQL